MCVPSAQLSVLRLEHLMTFGGVAASGSHPCVSATS